MSLIFRSALVALLLFAGLRVADAQTDSNISVGVDYGIDMPRSDALERTEGFGISFRLPRPDAWSAAWDFGALSSDLVHSFSGPPDAIGSLSVRPLLAGVAYRWRMGRLEATTALTAGVSLVNLDLSDRGRELLRNAFRTGDAAADGAPALAVQPKLIMWFDINRWFAVGGTTSYLRTRPDITITMPTATVDEFHVNADMVRLSVGLVVKVF